MKKGSFFRKLLLYLLCACLLTAAFSGAIYGFTAVHILTDRIAQELLSRAVSLSVLCSGFIDGRVVFDSFYGFVSSELRGARVYIYDGQGNLLLGSATEEKETTGETYAGLAAQILQGGNGVAATSVNWRSGVIAVAVPIMDNLSRTNGVVVLAKPAREVRGAVGQLIGAMLLSIAASALVMLLPAYFGSRRIASPIRQMTAVALRMAGGDFSARADESFRGEIGMLGGALNHLSGELSNTIGNLVLARSRLTAILTGIDDGVVALGADLHTVTFCNPAGRRLLRGPDDVSLLDALPEAIGDTLSAALSSDTAVQTNWTVGERELQLTCSRSQSDTGSEPGVVVLLRDVTEAERLERTRRDYVANVSHELRTPIASIRSLAETLNDGLVRSEEDRTRYYGYILRESLRLSRLIDDLLELSRLQSGTVALERKPFDLNELLMQVADRMRLDASYSGIDLQYVPAALPLCLSNRDRIEQVLVALVDNAIKYASDDGIVRLSCREEGGRLCVEVRNSGHIGERDLPHLFERFYKADQAHAGQGTGLGLAIAREILLQLDGTIDAANDGEFAVFTFTVPCVRGAPALAEGAQPAGTRCAGDIAAPPPAERKGSSCDACKAHGRDDDVEGI